MNQAILDFVGKTLIDIGNKIKEGKCELTDEQASLILGTVGHIGPAAYANFCGRLQERTYAFSSVQDYLEKIGQRFG